jgi:hypothetical protein
LKTRNTYIALCCAVFLIVTLAVSTTAAATTSPTSDTQTLMSSLTPEKATLGQSISWLVWTDPSLSGQAVTLTITDLNNDTVLNGYPKNVNLGGSNGSRIVTVSTAGYTTHEYQFKANTTSGNMKLASSRYQNFESSSFFAFASPSPHRAIPGEAVELTLSEFPYVDAVANVTFGNSTYTKQTWSNIAIPASNGSRIIKGVSTTGLKAGNYQFEVNATSSIGARLLFSICALRSRFWRAQDNFLFLHQAFYACASPRQSGHVYRNHF